MARTKAPRSRSRRMMMAAVMLGALAGTPAARAAPPTQVVTDISKYCQACWRNARLPVDRWDDCTHDVFVRLLERLEAARWNCVLTTEDTQERREFLRAIDAVRKRVQRERKLQALPTDLATAARANSETDEREAVDHHALHLLTPRQQRVLQLFADGWKVPDIARELGTTPARVSDEKYKAIKKLQLHLCPPEH
ncbi:MAG: sigma-70 family RNA polymerase sigma factor [Gemmataceae bacterium]|nr:sigma-70 family RNA polymerase sigma factor [Gemmataceae bacterium]MCS7269875.1 sigma-70 family RNA polymerase sigma factor [Gemmataceae bacterium]MDW8243598.1 sigma-70 family RNA polymerase sigma factor [Thermogemmata sp.]